MGEAYLHTVMARALEAAQERVEKQAWRERLRQWRERWAGRAEGAIRVILEAPGQAARIVTEDLEALVRPGGLWQFAPAPVPILTKGAVRVRGGKAAPPPATVALAPGTPQARVAVTGEIGEVVVRIDELPPGQTPPLVLLIPTKEGSEPKVEALEQPKGVVYLIARFENVEPGDYLVAFEPMGGG